MKSWSESFKFLIPVPVRRLAERKPLWSNQTLVCDQDAFKKGIGQERPAVDSKRSGISTEWCLLAPLRTGWKPLWVIQAEGPFSEFWSQLQSELEGQGTAPFIIAIQDFYQQSPRYHKYLSGFRHFALKGQSTTITVGVVMADHDLAPLCISWNHDRS